MSGSNSNGSSSTNCYGGLLEVYRCAWASVCDKNFGRWPQDVRCLILMRTATVAVRCLVPERSESSHGSAKCYRMSQGSPHEPPQSNVA